MDVVTVRGHHCKSGGRRVYEGLIKYPTDDPPETIDVDGVMYWRVPDFNNITILEPGDAIVMDGGHDFHIAKATPEDGMRRETRGASL